MDRASRSDKPQRSGLTFNSKRDAVAFLATQLTIMVWLPAMLVLAPPILPFETWIALNVPTMLAIISFSIRAYSLAYREKPDLGILSPFSGTTNEARVKLTSREAWEEAYVWLGMAREKAASARYATLWLTGILIAVAVVQGLLNQTDG